MRSTQIFLILFMFMSTGCFSDGPGTNDPTDEGAEGENTYPTDRGNLSSTDNGGAGSGSDRTDPPLPEPADSEDGSGMAGHTAPGIPEPEPRTHLAAEIEDLMPEWDRSITLQDLLARAHFIVHGSFKEIEVGRSLYQNGAQQDPMSLVTFDVIEVLRGQDTATVFFEFQMDADADVSRAQLSINTVENESIIFLTDNGVVEYAQDAMWSYEGASQPQGASLWFLTSPNGIIIDDHQVVQQVGGDNYGSATTVSQLADELRDDVVVAAGG